MSGGVAGAATTYVLDVPFEIAPAAASTAAAHGDYAHGLDCLWHGPLDLVQPDENRECLCPVCFLPLRVVRKESFWAGVAVVDKALANYEAMLRWSTGKCFPDYTTLEEAWRQASTE